MERLELSSATVLRLAPHIVFRFDDTRQRLIMPAPERVMGGGEGAVERREVVGGKASGGETIDTRGHRYPREPREGTGGAATAMRQDRAERGCLTNDRMDCPAPGAAGRADTS